MRWITGDVIVDRLVNRHSPWTADRVGELNRPGKSCVIVSASGMATVGRVLHHLKHQLPNGPNSVILTGFHGGPGSNVPRSG